MTFLDLSSRAECELSEAMRARSRGIYALLFVILRRETKMNAYYYLSSRALPERRRREGESKDLCISEQMTAPAQQ